MDVERALARHPTLERFNETRAQKAQNRIADAITRFSGSMVFVYIHIVWFTLWIAAGIEDYPYGLLTMIVSLEAIFLSTFVMIAQNRQRAVADARAQLDYEVNVRAEAEVARLKELLEALLEHHDLEHPLGDQPAR